MENIRFINSLTIGFWLQSVKFEFHAVEQLTLKLRALNLSETMYNCKCSAQAIVRFVECECDGCVA